MAPHQADRLYSGGTLALDLCCRCLAVWFDDKELLQLSPAASIQLLGEFAKEDAGRRTPLEPSLACPRCAKQLVETHDRQRNTRFWYHRCPAGHGRFMTSYQFLRAKDFVRPLSESEMAELREHIRQVNCGNCGAPVDIERDAICGFCRTPVAVVDADQVRKLLERQRRTEQASASHRPVDQLRAAPGKVEGRQAEGGPVRQAQGGPDPTLPITLALERMRAERAWAGTSSASRQPNVLDLFFGNATDPIAGGLRALSRLLGG
jgi:Zn-finger nucleic acid-binding protein